MAPLSPRPEPRTSPARPSLPLPPPPSPPLHPSTQQLALAFTRYCFTSRLYCTIIFFANTPFIVQYIAQYYQLLHPPPNFEVFLRGVCRCFCCFLGSNFGWVEVFEKKNVFDTERGALLHIIVQYPPPSPPSLPTILRNIMYVCKDSAAPAHACTRAHRPAAPHQSSGVSQTSHPTAIRRQAFHTDHHR